MQRWPHFPTSNRSGPQKYRLQHPSTEATRKEGIQSWADTGAPPIRTLGNSTNTTTTYRPWYRDQLILTHNPSHSTRELCQSNTSRGPDLASYEKLYCRMSDKSLWQFCSDNKTTNCFSTDLQQVVSGGFSAMGSGAKKYRKIVTWGGEKEK